KRADRPWHAVCRASLAHPAQDLRLCRTGAALFKNHEADAHTTRSGAHAARYGRSSRGARATCTAFRSRTGRTAFNLGPTHHRHRRTPVLHAMGGGLPDPLAFRSAAVLYAQPYRLLDGTRSEERRVGKGCRGRAALEPVSAVLG